MQSGYEGWDYVTPPESFCECAKPQVNEKGICLVCGRPQKSVTLKIDNVSVALKSVIKLSAKGE